MKIYAIALYSLILNSTVFGQNNLWLSGSGLINFNNSSSIESLTLPQPVPQPREEAIVYAGEKAAFSQNIQYDVDGDLLFFIIDGQIWT